MRIGKLLIVSFLGILLFMTGCGKEISIDEFKRDNAERNIGSSVETDGDMPVKQDVGMLTHGVDWPEEETDYSFDYEGGTLEIPYSMNGSGICTSVGFLIFLDGVPQPYRIKDTEEEYKYMHVIEGEEKEEKKFVISFVPVKGKAGDKMKLSINSIANPSFIPDMVNTFDYGMSHNSIEAVYDITFRQDTEIMPEIFDTADILKNIEEEQTDIDKEEKKYIEEKSLESELDLDENVYSDLIIDENSMLLDKKMCMEDKDTVHVSYIMMGHPGIKYKVNFYLNHQLLTDASGKVCELELGTGKMNTIEFDMDVSAVTEGSFYAVAVPVNTKDYPDDAIGTRKYQSIHLYRGENMKETEKMEEADTTKSEEKRSKTDIGNLEATLKNFGHVKNTAYVSKDRLLVVADQLYLIDVISGEIVASNKECSYATGEIKVYSDDTNIIIVGEESREVGDEEIVFYDPDDEDAPKKSILYYDDQLNLVDNINLYNTFDLNPSLVQYIAMSKSGKIAVYDDNCGELYLCDIDTKEKKKIFGENDAELIYNNQMQFIISGGIEFVQNDERIVFQADCMDYPIEDGANAYCGIGSVTIDGKDFFVEKAGAEYTKLESFDNYAILSQDCGFSSPTGEVIKYTFDTAGTENLGLKAKAESESVYCSERGSLLAASERSDNKGWNIRFYDAGTGKLLEEKSYDNLSSEKYTEPEIYTYENLNIAILLFYTNDGTGKDKLAIMQI